MIEIRIETIPHAKQRYETLGDWFDVEAIYKIKGETPPNRSVIRISDMNNPKYEFLLALHELVEMYLCRDRGISAKEVDDFDLKWKGDGEPGNYPAAPYFREHQFASVIERMMAHELEVNWEEYDKQCNEVSKGE